MTYYNDSYFMLHLSNKLYDFTETEEIQCQESLLLKKFSDLVIYDRKQTDGPDEDYKLDVRLSDLTNEKKIKELGFKNRREFLIWYFEKILSKKKKMKLTANYFIYVMSCGKYYSHNHNKIIDKAFKRVEIDLNIKNLLNQVLQLDKLKKLVLTYQQVILFDFFPKKLLTLQEKVTLNTKTITHGHHDKNNSMSIQNQIQTKVDYESFKKLLNAFEIISTSETTDETTQQINKQLIFLLGTELRSVLKASLQLNQDQNSKNIKQNNDDQNGEDKNKNTYNVDGSLMGWKNGQQIHYNNLLVQQNIVEDVHLQNLISRFMNNVASSKIQVEQDQTPLNLCQILLDDSPQMIKN